MRKQIRDTLRRVALAGGSPEDRALLRNELGPVALDVAHELRLVGLGCADAVIVDRIEQAAAHL